MTKMINKSIVFVVGAGASKEAGLPIGAELKNKIAVALDIRFDDFGTRQVSGDATILQAIKAKVSQVGGQYGDANSFLNAGWRIRDAMPQAASIDNFIDAHRHDPRIRICGKIAIASCILDAELKSTLHISPGNIYNKLNFKAVESTWFNMFFRLLVDGCQQTGLQDRFSKIAVITFNYDRCIEHYLHAALQNYYGMNSDQSREILSSLDIYHPYGSIGSLPWQLPGSSVDFGANANPSLLLSISDQIKTFAEGTDESQSEIVAIREALREAQRVAFLGFSFNPQNLQLLYGDSEKARLTRQRPVFGTAYGISNSDVAAISREIATRGGHPVDQVYLEREFTCVGLFNEYQRGLSVQ